MNNNINIIFFIMFLLFFSLSKSEGAEIIIERGVRSVLSLSPYHPLVQKTVCFAEELAFDCKIYHHESSGFSSGMAAESLGINPENIIKSLYMKDSIGNKVAVILKGTDKLDTMLLKSAWIETFPFLPPLKKLTFATSEDLDGDLNYLPGGVPPIIFKIKDIPVFVDIDVYNLDLATGSGGTEFDAMEFDPKQLTSIGYHLVHLKR